jgi:hypothetical protein
MANDDDDETGEETEGGGGGEPDELEEVYRCNADMEANRAIVEVLEPESIAAFRRDRVSHALPAPDAEPGGYFIAVPKDQADEARRLLAEALDDEVLDPDEGEVIEVEG